MTTIIFYEKPGCANNTRQKKLLQAAGHEVIARSLLTEAWTRERLRSFFGDRPVAEWINRAAPRVKSGEVVPEQLDANTALDLMLADPLFIRRPLLEADDRREAGFDCERIHAWIGLTEMEDREIETCARSKPCPAPGSS
jgi:nitrogenase-associated protein